MDKLINGKDKVWKIREEAARKHLEGKGYLKEDNSIGRIVLWGKL